MKSFFLIVVTVLLSGVVSFLVSSANLPTSSISRLVFGEKINPQDNMPHVSLSLATSDGRNLKTSFEKTSTLVSVRDYAPQHMVGEASDFTLDRQVKAGANSVFLIENSLIHQGEHVVGENIPQDTVVTSIESSHPVSKDFTLSKTTLMTADENPYAPSNGGMSTLLIVNENALVPMGADVAGIGIPAHTHVIKTDGNRIYIDNDVTQTLTSGVNIKISWKSMKVSLSGSVSSDINVGAFIGFYTQDDADVFQRAVNAMNDGKGGNVYVPGGVYYLGHMVVTRPRSSFVVASSVQFIHGSASIDSDNGGSPYSQYNLYSSAHTQQPVVMNISQNIYKTNVPSIQGQALSITQMNSNCVHDLDVWGCGELGEEIHQSAAANVRRGQLWAYHSTAYASVGQLLHWTGAELEYENNSGWYGAFSGNPLLPGQNGLHIDDIGDTPNTNALEPAGAWHVGVACDGNIMDWCVEMGAGRNSNQQGLPSAGIDSAGRVFGNRFIASVPGPDTFDSIGVVTAETRYAQMASDGAVSGQIFNAGTLENITAGVSSVDIVDGGMFNAPVSLVVGAPPVSGVQAALSVDTYALRAVQGGIAINATTRGNAPDGVESGMVFDLPGGECRVQPQVVYDGARFAIRQGGECARLPDATIPLGMERTRLTLRYVSGGSGKPQTLPIIEPLYGVRTVSVRESGAGYNIAPGVLAITDHVDNKWRGIIYTPVKMNVHLNAHPRANAIHVGSSLMSSELPLRCSPGDLVYVPDGRNAGESSGTGALAYCNNRNVWMVNGQPVRH